MESVRIYVPQNRVQEPPVEQSLKCVISRGATLYNAIGAWPHKTGIISEDIVVVEVLDCQPERQQAINELVAALLAAGEEAVLVTKQQTVADFAWARDHPVKAGVSAD